MPATSPPRALQLQADVLAVLLTAGRPLSVGQIQLRLIERVGKPPGESAVCSAIDRLSIIPALYEVSGRDAGGRAAAYAIDVEALALWLRDLSRGDIAPIPMRAVV